MCVCCSHPVTRCCGDENKDGERVLTALNQDAVSGPRVADVVVYCLSPVSVWVFAVLVVWLLNATCSQTGILNPDFVLRGAELQSKLGSKRKVCVGGRRRTASELHPDLLVVAKFSKSMLRSESKNPGSSMKLIRMLFF